jgi:hypothetical protein
VFAPPQPRNSCRVILELTAKSRIDAALLAAFRGQADVPAVLKTLSRSNFKKLFKDKRVHLKGYSVQPSTMIAAGTTYIDILGIETAGPSDGSNGSPSDSTPS